MDKIYGDIAARTGGNIYIGVVGPVRTGKSTLVKRIMEQLVIPRMDDPYRVERARDELPQSGSGKTIMTSEPKFVPEEAVEISPDGTTRLRIRMIDSVGYLVPGAVGAMEDGQPRMVTTPWFEHEIPMTQAAELGTQKVMQEHCTIGLVVTTDGSICDIDRQDYREAERRAISDMQATGKPFLIVLNSRNPGSEAAKAVQRELEKTWNLPVFLTDCQEMEESGIEQLFRGLLAAFPMRAMEVYLPGWVEALEPGHPAKTALYENLRARAEEIQTLGQAPEILAQLAEVPPISAFSIKSMDYGTGIICCTIALPESMFYQILSEKTGMEINGDADLMTLLTQLSQMKQEYDKLADALASVKATGYGVVMPTAGEMKLEAPQLIRRGGSCGVKLKAGAPSIHMLRVDIDTEITPMVGDERQSQALIAQLQGEDPEAIWQSNIFGKSVYGLIQEGLTAKLVQLPEEVREKFRGTLTRIVNTGATGLICLIL